VSTSLLSAAAAAGVPLSDLPILKDQTAAQRSKLLQLLQEQNMAAASLAAQQQQQQKPNAINRQVSQPISSQKSSYFGSSGGGGGGGSNNSNQSSGFTTPTGGLTNQWSNFNSSMSMVDQVDDRITPFIPGQLWAGQPGQSVEDDPNCTPGSVSKPLLHETIDPESILTSLQRAGSGQGSTQGWPNALDFGLSALSGSNSKKIFDYFR
jgi:hypothetical protein